MVVVPNAGFPNADGLPNAEGEPKADFFSGVLPRAIVAPKAGFVVPSPDALGVGVLGAEENADTVPPNALVVGVLGGLKNGDAVVEALLKAPNAPEPDCMGPKPVGWLARPANAPVVGPGLVVLKGDDDGVLTSPLDFSGVAGTPKADDGLGVLGSAPPNAEGTFVGVFGASNAPGVELSIAFASLGAGLPNGDAVAWAKAENPPEAEPVGVEAPPNGDAGLAALAKDDDPKPDCPNVVAPKAGLALPKPDWPKLDVDVGVGVPNPVLPNAEAGFTASEVLGVAGLNAEEPNAEVPWFAKAPNPPVAGLTILDEVDELVFPKVEVF